MASQNFSKHMNIKNQIEIKHLIDCQEHIPVLAELLHEELARHWVTGSSVEKAKERLILHSNKDKMPMAVVALHEGSPAGMACLRETDGIQPCLTPWLASLVVNPKFREIKIGETLIEAVKSQARKLGHSMLYLLAFDPTIPNWYVRLGWQSIGNDELFGHRVVVMSIAI